jgi:ATP-binding cassette subfamily B (MDR/TAP) protein 1
MQALTSSFVTAPKLAGFLFATIPLLLFIIGILSWANNIVGVPANNLEGRVSTLVEQILSSVRIVQSFNMGSSLMKRLDGELLEQLRKLCAKRSMIRSLEQSSVYFAVFLTYSMAFWFGGNQVRKGLETGRVMTVSTTASMRISN